MEFQFSEEEQMLRTRVKSLAEEKIAPLSEAAESETIARELMREVKRLGAQWATTGPHF